MSIVLVAVVAAAAIIALHRLVIPLAVAWLVYRVWDIEQRVARAERGRAP